MRRIVIVGLMVLLSAWMSVASEDGVAAWLNRGRELYEFGRWSDARHAFREAQQRLTPTQQTAREEIDFYLAVCAVELGSRDAEQALTAFSKRYPASTRNNAVRYALGSYYCAQGNMEQARASYAACDYKALSRSERERYNIRMGYVAFAEKNYEEAETYFARIRPESEYADHARYYQGYIDYAEGRLDEAKEAFARLQASDAYGELAPYYLLQIEFRQGNYAYVTERGEALAVRAVGERRTELERILAESWFHLEDYRKTLAHLDTYQAVGGEENRDCNYLRGFSLYRLARHEEAAAWLRKTCGPEDALTQNASYHLADCYLRQGNKEAAMQAFAMATDDALDGTIAEDALFNYAKLQYELGGGAFNGAIHVLGRYVERYPRSPRVGEARTLLIAAYYNSRDYDAAYRAIKAMPAMDAELRAALQKITYFRALEAYEAEDMEAAKRYLTETLSLGVSPRYTALSNFWQGEIAYGEGNYAQAVTNYNAYLGRAPRAEREYALALYNLGYCYFSQERMTQAETAFKQFINTYTYNDAYRCDALNRLGDTAYADRRFDEALRRYQQTMTQGGVGSDYAAYKRAVTLGVLGRVTEKQAALQQIVRQGKGNYLEEAHYDLGRTCIARENYAEGATQLERFVAKYPQSSRCTQAYADLGLAYQNLGEKEKSLAAYRKVVASAPQSAEAREALHGIRDIYVSDGDVEGYFAYAEEVGVERDLSEVARDSLSFAAAQKLYLADRRSDAERSLRSYLKSYPKGAYRADALYYLCDCYLVSEQRAEAISTLSELANLGSHQYTLQALQTLSRMCWEDERYAEAATAYRQLYAVSTVAAEREAAMTRYVRATMAVGDRAQIAAMAADVLKCTDAGATAHREAKFAWAEQMRGEGRTEAAHALYQELASDVSTKEGSAAAYYVIEHDYADGAGDKEKTEQAIFAYSKRMPKAYWLAKAYLLLGDLYVQKGDLFQARATYQSVADGYSPADDGIVTDAQARIQKLNE
ncbi:MAG: tetratricopeptide repeat protein [Alistipes sp.]|nr:tetratricopeptide repeat protein [Alistipes sp.]